MTYWPWWLCAVALSAIPLAHWIMLRRAFAVSGRYSALVDRVRFGSLPESAPVDTQAMLEALRAQTAEAFGPEALEPMPESLPTTVPSTTVPALTNLSHLVFFGGILLGGLLSAWLAGQAPVSGLRGEGLAALLSHLPVPEPVWLGFGGLLVGFGTRMAGGCTSGHGLCGVSQLQPGSLLATGAFFGAGVATSFALGALL